MAETPKRSFKVPDPEYDRAWNHAVERREPLSDMVRRAFRDYPDDIYRAEVYRDGEWWMIRVPEIDGLTQARTEEEVWTMARELVALAINKNPRSNVNVALVMLPRAKEEES